MSIQATTFLNTYRKKMDKVQKILLDAFKEIICATEDVLDITQQTQNLKLIIEAIEHVSQTTLKQITEILEELPTQTIQELNPQVEKARKEAIQGYTLLAKIAYITHLATQDQKLLHLGALFYAASKALQKPATKPRPLYIIAAIHLATKNPEHALALAAYGTRDKLPIKHQPREKPWQNPHKWAALLQASYMYEIATKTNAELLAEWGLLEILQEEEE